MDPNEFTARRKHAAVYIKSELGKLPPVAGEKRIRNELQTKNEHVSLISLYRFLLAENIRPIKSG